MVAEYGEPTENTKAIVWLSYNVHGNETSSSEAAMHSLYELVTSKVGWLNDVVVIMDPMLTPMVGTIVLLGINPLQVLFKMYDQSHENIANLGKVEELIIIILI